MQYYYLVNSYLVNLSTIEIMHDNYFESKEFKENLSKYEEGCQTGEPVYLDSEALTDIAEYYHSAGRSEDAIVAADYALSMFQGATAPLVFKARMALLKGADAQEADKIAEQIIDKTDLDYYYIKGEIMIADGRPTAADCYFEDCADNLSDEEYADYVLDVATVFADYDQMEYANKWLLKSGETHLADYRELLGRIYLGTGRFEESEQIFSALIDESPFTAAYWNLMASAQFMQNKFNDCITSSEYAIAINPQDEDALLNKANSLLNLDNFEESYLYYKRYTDSSQNKEIGELYQGISLLNLNRIQEAVTHLQAAEQYLTPHSTCQIELFQEMAFAQSRLGHTDEALRYIDKTDTLDCDHNEMLVLRGHIVLESHREDEADFYFHKALQDSNYSPNILFRIAVSLFDNHYVSQCYKMLRSMIEVVDNDWNKGYSYLAACAMEMGNREEYLYYLKEAVERNPIEAKNVLKDLFPEGMSPEDYYLYAKNEAQPQ